MLQALGNGMSVLKVLRKRYLIIIFLFFAGASSYFRFFNQKSPEPEPLKVVETEKVTKSEITHEIDLIGTVRPKHYCVLTAKARGTIDTLVLAGSVLKKGDVIAKIENPDIEKTYELSMSVEKIARDQHERMRLLAQKRVKSQKESEDTLRSLMEAEKDLAKARIEQKNTMVEAPFDGILGAYKVKDGEQVAEGCPLASFYNPEQLQVEFEIPSQYVMKIEPGQLLYINHAPLKLTHVQKAIDEESHMCPASASVTPDPFSASLPVARYASTTFGAETTSTKENASGATTVTLIGNSVAVRLVVEQKKDVIVIPHSAVFFRNGKNVVYVIENGKTVLREVELGIRNKERVEILSGLKENDEIICIGQDRLSEDMEVRIASKAAEAVQ
ncbi:MexH family multidrug efflux RND transporter periplasmic adaptor subunit [Alphaproteobacteria bacterium]|nr:MexH family multidrug efflux RND transporter periplasmic adaptor subunit [Alphaproteobacteria bacterium]